MKKILIIMIETILIACGLLVISNKFHFPSLINIMWNDCPPPPCYGCLPMKCQEVSPFVPFVVIFIYLLVSFAILMLIKIFFKKLRKNPINCHGKIKRIL